MAAGPTAIDMPRLTDSMEEGTIVRWLKAVGDTVAVGDELVEVETDKANMACESFAAGTLLAVVADEGDSCAIGDTIAWIGEPGAEPPASTPPASRRVAASPVARRMAEARGLDLATVAGSGPVGRITKVDVEAATDGQPEPTTATPPPAPADKHGKGEVSVVEPTRLQETVARRMAESWTTVPHFYLRTTVDMTRCRSARASLKAATPDGEPSPSFNDLVVKASALALRKSPRANGSYRDGRFELYSRVNVGVAVAADDALVVPTIFDADRRGLYEIALEARRLAQRVRDGSITPPELADGTFTVSNLGTHGVEGFDAVVNPPQAAILAVGTVTERSVARDGTSIVAPTMHMTLACDHRILYGADGAALLQRIRELLEEPTLLAG